MKIILRIGERYALSKIYISLLAVATIMCLYAVKQVSAQVAEPAATAVADIKPIQIGDTIPEYIWHLPLQVVNHPGEKKAITLNDHRGKLIILDFWGPWCVPCIDAMPAIHAVQEQLADQMAVIPVSWSKPDVTLKALQTHRTLKPLHLSSVVEAKTLIAHFPHNVVPHYAWIAPNGEVIATTAANDVSPANVAKVLGGEKPDYALKTHIDTEKPLLFMLDDLPKHAEVQQYAVFIKGEIASLPSDVTVRESGDIIHGMSVSNRKLFAMYKLLARSMLGRSTQKRLSVVDSIRDDSYYTFDFILPVADAVSFYDDLLAYLNRRSGYHGMLAKRQRDCLVLTSIGEGKDFMGSDGPRTYQNDSLAIRMRNCQMKDFISRLDWPDIAGDRIAVNETGYEGSINITLHAPYDLGNIRKQLNAQGLDLIEAEREVEIFEIRKSIPNR